MDLRRRLVLTGETVGFGTVVDYSQLSPFPCWTYWDALAREYRGPYATVIEAVAVGVHAAEIAWEG